MAKRFTETTKWSDKWFRTLPAGSKLVFLYLCDNCDGAGFYEIDFGMMAFQIGVDAAVVEGSCKGLSKPLLYATDGSDWVWLKSFLRHQKNLPLNPDNRAHRPIIASLEEHAKHFPEGAFKGLGSPTGKGKGKGKGNNIGSNERDPVTPVSLSGEIAGFAQFWELLPPDMQCAKGAVIKRHRRAVVDGATVDQIHQGMARQLLLRSAAEPGRRRFFGGLDKWFEGECWADTDESVKLRMSSPDSDSLVPRENIFAKGLVGAE